MNIKNDGRKDYMPLLLDILRTAKNGDTLVFERGTYNFYPEHAFEVESCISNHDADGLKKVAFFIKNIENIVIDGNGAEFIFHETMVPFQIENSKNVCLKNFSIDYPDVMYAQSTVLASGSDFCDIKMFPGSNYRIENNKLCPVLEGGFSAPVLTAMEFDPVNECVEYNTNNRDIRECTAESLDNGVVRLKGEFEIPPKAGNLFFMHYGQRFAASIFINKSENTEIEKVTVHTSRGMGILAQISKNINITDYKVTPSTGNFVTCQGDGAHFVNCCGDIVLDRCHIEKQMDDSMNCHGIYLQIYKIVDDNKVIAKSVHQQQQGVPMFRNGDTAEFIRTDCMVTQGSSKIKNVDLVSHSVMILEFEDTLPDTINEGDCIENITLSPNLTVKNSYFGKNRARGLILTTCGKILIEGNTFEKAGCAMKMAGNPLFWFESGRVQDVTVRNNTFIDCNANDRWGKAVIDIVPAVKYPDAQLGFVHENILIENNTFRVFDMGLVYATLTNNLVVRNNKYEKTNTYPRKGIVNEHVTLIECGTTDIQTNWD
ncbi:MAG: right-handed parallel beta-helix repeat-containing protein [Clostridia bacterium]|nr:right-handed parallel beta-helix repeat-containing protein [Clostridia bacterium]